MHVFGHLWYLLAKKVCRICVITGKLVTKMIDFRNRLLTVRLTASEHSQLKERIQGLNVSISSFIRNLLIKELKSSSTVNKPVGKNAPCPCGSGRKYKKCCLNRVA